MSAIVFTTCDKWPNLYESDQPIATAFQALGNQMQPVRRQDDFDRFAATNLITLPAHWDYHYTLPAFSFLYRVLVLGVPIAEARQTLHQIGQLNPIWRQFIDEQLAAYSSGTSANA